MPLSKRNKRRNKRLLAYMREGARKSVESFAPGKMQHQESEVWDVKEFLRNLGVNFGDDEVVPEKGEAPDVHFRDAHFEVKRIYDAGRNPHEEYKAALAKARSVSNPSELFQHHTPRELTPTDIGRLVSKRIAELDNKYEAKFRRATDLLLSINLAHQYLNKGPMPACSLFRDSGWRSVSALKGWNSLIFYARNDAPSFLRPHAGTLIERKFE